MMSNDTSFVNYTNQQLYDMEWMFKMEEFLELTKTIYTPLFFVVGVIGNCLGLTLIWSDKRLSRIATNYHLSALAVSGSVFLTSWFLMWTEKVLGINIYRQVYGCKLFTMLAHTADFAVNWSIVFVSFERVVILYHIRWFYRHTDRLSMEAARRHFAKLQLIVLTIVAILLNSWILIVAHPVYYEQYGVWQCHIDEDLREVYNVMFMLEVFFAMILPWVLFTLFTLAAIHRYRQCIPHVAHVRFQKSTDSMYISTQPAANGAVIANGHVNNEEHNDVSNEHIEENGTPHQHQNGVAAKHSRQHHSMPALKGDKSNLMVHRDSRRVARSHMANRQPTDQGTTATGAGLNNLTPKPRNSIYSFSANESRLTRTLLTLITVYIMLNLPINVLKFVYINATIERTIFVAIIDYVCWLLFYMHYAILFYLYIFWTPAMRKQVRPTAIRLLECYCLKPVQDTSWDGTPMPNAYV